MLKHNTVTRLPAAPPPRLAAQLFVALGELVMVGICVVGVVTVAGWIISGADLRSKAGRHSPAPREIWHCWYDRRYGGDPLYTGPLVPGKAFKRPYGAFGLKELPAPVSF